MSLNFLKIVAIGCAVAAPLSQSLAGASDYEVASEVKAGSNAPLAVRLIHKPTNKPVAGAVLFRMRPRHVARRHGRMTGALTPDASTEPGVYAFKAISAWRENGR